MGGCRCTYHNCTSRTDGVTHLFHYPVFHRSRCHQWLVNAGRLDFLELTLSQLKNRVICQHHFGDSDFMNCLKEKLKPSAVPLFRGPFCTTNPKVIVKTISQNKLTHNIVDIEEPRSSEYLNFTYNQFLNKDAKNGSSNNLAHAGSSSLFCSSKLDAKTQPAASYQSTMECPLSQTIFSNNLETNNDKNNDNSKVQILSQKIFKSEPKVLTQVLSSDVQEVFDSPVAFVKLQPKAINPLSALLNVNDNNARTDINKAVINENEIDILSNNAKEIVETDVNKSIEIEINTNCRIMFENDNILKNPVVSNSSDANRVTSTNNSENLFTKTEKSVLIKGKPQKQLSKGIEEKSTFNMKYKDALEVKATNDSEQLSFNPEKRAPVKFKPRKQLSKDIEEKRKFNMKLRDALEAQARELEQEKLHKSQTNKTSPTLINKRLLNQDIASYLSEEPDLPSKTEYNFSSLVARMKQMEDLLLHKIDQNSERIVELRSAISPSKEKKAFSKTLKRSVFTQSGFDEETHKKQLYAEISKYLSPNASSLVYEELFINKFGVNGPKVHKRKRRI